MNAQIRLPLVVMLLKHQKAKNMKIGILHLSDLHIQDNTLNKRIDNLVKSVEYDIKEIYHLYIVFSGDIAYYGRKTDFDNAKSFVCYAHACNSCSKGGKSLWQC